MASLAATLASCKTRGNDAFGKKRWAEAARIYSEGITEYEAVASTADDSLRTVASQLYSNRSAAHLEAGAHEQALIDASAAVEANPRWAKAYARRAAALRALRRHREAADALEEAARLDPSERGLVKLLAEARAEAASADAREPVRSVSHFASVFRALGAGNPLRLATLATWWNLMTPALRWRILRRFLLLIGGPAAVDASLTGDAVPTPHISQFRAEALTALPMDNYAHLSVPAPWVAFARSLSASDSDGGSAAAAAAGAGAGAGAASGAGAGAGAGGPSEDVVSLFNACWDLCSAAEQSAVVADIRTFFAPPEAGGALARAVRGGGGGGAGSGGDGDSGDSSDADEDEAAAAARNTALVRGGGARGLGAGAAMDAPAVVEALRRLGIGAPQLLQAAGALASSGAPAAAGGAHGVRSDAPVRLPDDVVRALAAATGGAEGHGAPEGAGAASGASAPGAAGSGSGAP